MTKPVEFRGSALGDLRAFPRKVTQRAGHQIDRVQRGLESDDWKPMKSIGPGVQEIRIRSEGSAYRVIFIAKLADAVYVLHCFQKTTEKTSKADLAIAAKRYRELMEEIGK